jgi:hypothetical protein
MYKRCGPQALKALKHWLHHNAHYPYPTEADMAMLSASTKLSEVQLERWFEEARLVYWQPMVDGGVRVV